MLKIEAAVCRCIRGENRGSSGKSTGSSSPAMSADLKASSNNGSGAHPGSGSGDANHKSAGSSTPAKSSSTPVKSNDGGGRDSTRVSAVPISNQTGSLALAREKEVGSPRKNNTAVASPAVKNQEQTSSGIASGGSSGTVNKQKGYGTQGQGSAGSSKDHSAQAVTSKSGNNSKGNVSTIKQDGGSSGNKKVDWFKQVAGCDLFHGHWVRDDSYPLYPEGSCPHIDEPFDCYLNGRRDLAYQKLRWQPSGCSIPR